MAVVEKLRHCGGDSWKDATIEDTDLIEQRPIDFHGAIDQRLVLGAQQCAEDHREPLTDELTQLCLGNRLASNVRQSLVDRAANAGKGIDQRSVEIKQQVHREEYREWINTPSPTPDSRIPPGWESGFESRELTGVIWGKLIFDPYQLDVAHQHPARAIAFAAIGQALRNPEARAFALDHQRNTLSP